MEPDARADAAKLAPLIERAAAAERRLQVVGGALQRVVDAYDQFVDSETLEPLVDAIREARSTLVVVQVSGRPDQRPRRFGL